MLRFLRKTILFPLRQGISYVIAEERFFVWRPHAKFDRISTLMVGLACLSIAIAIKLFSLQVIDYGFYAALASDQHQIQRILQADRGQVYVRDHKAGDELFPVIVNKDYMQIYSVPRQIENPEETAKKLAPLVNLTKEELVTILSKENDPYEPVERKVPVERYEAIKALELAGIYGVAETHRYYLDANIGSNVTGFVGIRDEQPTGLYGIEGYFNELLAGQPGYFQTERDVAGRWIALSEKKITEAQNGADIVLTIDKTIQYMTCDALNKYVQQHGADGGAAIVMEPSTGKIWAMCSSPDFNPNFYSKVDSASVYNNKAIFESYEPGSIFKPIVMAAGIDLEYIKPDSTFVDEGFVKIDEFTIRNANDKVYGEQTMTQVLENSINTGMIHVARTIGKTAFKDYIQRFGFGELTGIELDKETAGNIRSLNLPGEIYMATGSFGQGLTVTPLQVAAAYAAIANGGKLMRPYIVDEIRYADGRVETRQPTFVRQVISPRSSVLATGMLTSVITNGHTPRARIPGYYVAGKTGTAQIASTTGRGYEEGATNHSFAGFVPADDPRFVVVIRLERPRSAPFADSTAAPMFNEIASFILNYLEVPPDYQ